MRIGEALAEARGQAGLTVTEVSQRTRIRETIIREIEDDDYSACGGDFYARGDIRSIAKAVGADPEPLIRAYDSLHRAPGALSAVSLEELTPAQAPGRRRRLNWAAVLGLALAGALGFAAYQLLSGPRHAASGPPAAGTHAAIPAGQSRTPQAPKTRPKAAGHVHTVVVHLTAIRSCKVVFSTPGGRHLFGWHAAAGASKAWTFRHAVHLKLDHPSRVTLTVDGKNPLPSGRSTQPITLIIRPDHRATVVARTLSGPVATVRAYVAAINRHHYARAWSLGGQNTGNTGGSYSAFANAFSTTARDTLTIVSVSGDVVTARLAARQTDGTTDIYQGTYTVSHGVIVGFDVAPVG